MFYNQGGGGPGHLGGFGYGGMPAQEYLQPRREPSPTRRDREGGYQYKTRQGIITKIQPDYGLIDDEVFFSMDTVLGFRPRLGLRVQAEASFDPNTHPRWRAVRVTALSQPAREERVRDERPSDRDRDRRERDIRPSARERDTGRERDAADRDARRRDEKRPERPERVEGGGAVSRKRSRSPLKPSGSPPRRRPMMSKVCAPRYNVDFSTAAVADLRRRYQSLYIPSDFFFTKSKWQESFPLQTPFSLDHVSSFHIFHKDVEPLSGPRQETHPVDADYKYSAKVMLLSMPGLEELYRKTLALAESGDAERKGLHPSTFLKFLVGTKGKHEYIPIGGPWSPSLDGADPENNPEVLVKTAIRTCKMLTGIDLSNCTQWCRFMEIYYRRQASGNKPASVETVVIYLPDVWSCMPTRIEWDGIKQQYKTALEQKLAGPKEEDGEEGVTKKGPPVDDKPAADTPADAASNQVKEEPSEEKPKEGDGEATSAQLTRIQIESMKVVEIKAELEARGLSTKGVKAELCNRLVEALEKEDIDAVEPKTEEEVEKMEVTTDTAATESIKTEEADASAEEVAKTEESKPAPAALDEKEKKHLEQIYTIGGSTPAIPVHPSRVAKKGEFNCAVINLKSLLDTPHGDVKEHTFEVYLFAELFQDMLFRDTGVEIYRALYRAPNFIEEEKKQRKEEKEAEAAAAAAQKAAEAAQKEAAAAAEEDIAKVLDEIPMEEGIDEDMLSKFVVVDQLDDDDTKKRDQPAKKPAAATTKENGKEPRPSSRASSAADSVKKKQKKYTADKKLLFSFIYYDQDQCGYIVERDMEDILLNIGLKLSRAQAKKLLSKIVGKSNLYYRKLTDAPVPEDGKTAEEPPAMDDPEGLAGNLYLLPSDETKTARVKEEQSRESAIVTYNGRVYNLDQLLQQAEKSERDRLLADSQLKKNQEELITVQSKYDSTASKLRRAEDDLKSLKSKLSSLESKLKDTKVSNEKFESALRLVYHHVAPFMEEKKTPSTPSENDK